MTIDQWNLDAFRGYEKPLQMLEKLFAKAGNPAALHPFVDPFGNKMVRILRDKAPQKVVCIIGASPAEAVKIIAAKLGGTV